MSDLRVILAQQVADLIGAVLYPNRCHCGMPLLELKEQRIPFCWGCTTDKQNAERGHDLLERIKRGITVKHIGDEIFVEFGK